MEYYLKECAQFAKAESLYRRALAIDAWSFSPDHPYASINLNNLAQLFQTTSCLSEVEPLMRRAVEIFETSLGLDHPNTITVIKSYELLFRQ